MRRKPGLSFKLQWVGSSRTHVQRVSRDRLSKVSVHVELDLPWSLALAGSEAINNPVKNIAAIQIHFLPEEGFLIVVLLLTKFAQNITSY